MSEPNDQDCGVIVLRDANYRMRDAPVPEDYPVDDVRMSLLPYFTEAWLAGKLSEAPVKKRKLPQPAEVQGTKRQKH